jgi:uncharacterized protein
MLRLLIIGILIYLLYVLGKGLFRKDKGIHRGSPDTGVIDEMVRDPVCETYIPKRQAIRRVIDNKEFFFCSKECADRFEAPEYKRTNSQS